MNGFLAIGVAEGWLEVLFLHGYTVGISSGLGYRNSKPPDGSKKISRTLYIKFFSTNYLSWCYWIFNQTLFSNIQSTKNLSTILLYLFTCFLQLIPSPVSSIASPLSSRSHLPRNKLPPQAIVNNMIVLPARVLKQQILFTVITVYWTQGARQVQYLSVTYPIPTDNCCCASGFNPETMIIAESGTAPSKGKTIPPNIK